MSLEAIAVLIAFIVALGSCVGFFIRRMDNFTPRREFDQHVDADKEHIPRREFEAIIGALNERFTDLVKRFESLHATVHEVRNMTQNILVAERRRLTDQSGQPHQAD